MQQNTKSSISVRLTPKCRDSVQLVTKNSSSPHQIRLINRNSNDFVLYEFDQIYGKDTNNQALYESLIFTQGVNSTLDLESGLFCFLGSQGVGKTYTVIGELNNVCENSGLLGYLMQNLFNNPLKISSQAKLCYSQFNSNAVELRFLQFLGQNVENIGFETVYGESTNEREVANRIDYKIDIKNLAHFENCINKIYERKKPHMHLVIQVSLKHEPLIYTTKKTTLTFIQVSSACYDEGNVHSQKIKSEVQALITIFQNIHRIKHLEHLFENSKLTKLLKNNFFQAKKLNLVGILDNSFKGNSMTLKWLKMSLQFKEDKTIIESMKEDIKKEEEYLKSLMEKHKKAMNLLSKCIGTELSFLERQKNFANSKRQIDFGFGNSFNKRCQKIKLANLKKQQNEEDIQKLNKEIAVIEEELNFMQCEHKESMKKLQEEKNSIINVKNKLVTRMQEMTQQLLYKNKFNANGNTINPANSLFWRPSIDFQNTSNLPNNDKKGEKQSDWTGKKEHSSRNSSLKISTNKINNTVNVKKSNVVIPGCINKIQRKKLNQYENQENLLLQVKRKQEVIKQQTKRQIYELFKVISQQQKSLENVIKHAPQKISTALTNKIKNRQSQNLAKILKNPINKYLKQGKSFELKNYQQFIQDQSIFVNISKDLNQKQLKTSHKSILSKV